MDLVDTWHHPIIDNYAFLECFWNHPNVLFVMPIQAKVKFASMFYFLEEKDYIWQCWHLKRNIITEHHMGLLIWEQQKGCDFQKSETSVPLKNKFLFSFCFPSTYKPHSLIRLLASLVSSNKKEWLIALGRTKSHRVAQLLTLLSQPLAYKSCSDSCPCGGRGPTDGRHSAHSPADINSSQSSHSI